MKIFDWPCNNRAKDMPEHRLGLDLDKNLKYNQIMI